MVQLAAYKKNFAPHSPPKALAQLLEFQNAQDGYFSDGFELATDDKGGLKSWSADAEFLAGLFPVGQANGSGSTYALWSPKSDNLAAAPVLVFGDEGGVHVVASDVLGLLRLLSYDAEPMVDHDSVSFYRDEDSDTSDGAEDYVEWLESRFELEPLTTDDEVESLIADAQKKHAAAYRAWAKNFYEE